MPAVDPGGRQDVGERCVATGHNDPVTLSGRTDRERLADHVGVEHRPPASSGKATGGAVSSHASSSHLPNRTGPGTAQSTGEGGTPSFGAPMTSSAPRSRQRVPRRVAPLLAPTRHIQHRQHLLVTPGVGPAPGGARGARL